MNKTELVQQIINQLSHDLEVFWVAAKTAHEAATHEENQPDNKYDTLALEASYVAQGQANRAQALRKSIEFYRNMSLISDQDEVRLTSLVTIVTNDGSRKTVFIGPMEGGLKIVNELGDDIMVITPTSPLGKELIGKNPGDLFEIKSGSSKIEYEIIEIY